MARRRKSKAPAPSPEAPLTGRRRLNSEDLILELSATAAPDPPPEPAPEPPARYGRTRLTLMEVDPSRLFVYWEITPEDRGRAGGPRPAWTIRFVEDGPARGAAFDVPVGPEDGSSYVDLPLDGRNWRAEIGIRGGDGSFEPFCGSNPLPTPRSGPSTRYAPRWASVAAAQPPRPAPFPRAPLIEPEARDGFGLSSPGNGP